MLERNKEHLPKIFPSAHWAINYGRILAQRLRLSPGLWPHELTKEGIKSW